jgi:hypothetical protein
VQLDTWADIVTSAREGLLDERTYCELKKGLPPSSQNAEVACDLASFTVDGGVLIYGIADAGSGKAGDVVGIPDPESARTRLIGLAQGKVEPSMVCDVRVVLNPDDPTRGCVIVEVPPSAIAPHRADQRYWGRSSEGKRVLPEPQVADLFATRRNRDDGLLQHLLDLSGPFDPVPEDSRAHGHLYFSAMPLMPPSGSTPWDQARHPLEVAVGAAFPRHGYGGGDLTSVSYKETHPHGIMAASVDRHENDVDEAYAKRLLIRDSGGVDFAAGLGTRNRPGPNNSPAHEVVPLAPVLIHVDQCVRLTAHIAQLRGDNGTWHLGVHMDRLLGLPSSAALNDMSIHRASAYAEESFTNDVHASVSEMLVSPELVVQKLMTPLVRGLGATHAFPYKEPQDFLRRNL